MNEDTQPHKRRPRYNGKNPRRFEDRYKELSPEKYPETITKVLASGRTPVGSHVPILVSEILEVLHPSPGEFGIDCTLGRGGHAEAILQKLSPIGKLLGLDIDPVELPKTELRLRNAGFDGSSLIIKKSNFAGIFHLLQEMEMPKADFILADLGVSSMQLDTPERGFSLKTPGPLDMRMNPERGVSASQFLEKVSPAALDSLLYENADEPFSKEIAYAIAGRKFTQTTDLANAIRRALLALSFDDTEKSVRRVFQAIRIAINEEFSALDALLRILPECLKPEGRAAILTFHSGEDRRVKKAFQTGLRSGIYSQVARDVIRPTPEECRANPRASSAKLRWAIRKNS